MTSTGVEMEEMIGTRADQTCECTRTVTRARVERDWSDTEPASSHQNLPRHNPSNNGTFIHSRTPYDPFLLITLKMVPFPTRVLTYQ
ncbi:hypothetical protein E2C01_012240 [Portunus trituberculatus]|uniref:Uncharacterized protein n=1 Tax=Portunus trituberculatus TaxID=210409 RepID=A0A5B7DDM7_PORTR|nr:hypothetical protein [Portunus trituberculatus]